jgi:hypothetical protein
MTDQNRQHTPEPWFYHEDGFIYGDEPDRTTLDQPRIAKAKGNES